MLLKLRFCRYRERHCCLQLAILEWQVIMLGSRVWHWLFWGQGSSRVGPAREDMAFSRASAMSDQPEQGQSQ